MIIDEFLPLYDVSERHAIEVRASPATAYAALREVDFADNRILRVLMALRALPATLVAWRRHGRVRPRRQRETLAALEASGFVLLGDVPGSEVLLGIEGRFWALDGGRCTPPASDFRSSPPQAGTARAVWNFTFTPLDPSRTRIATETRVLCADAAARRRFLPYWYLIRPASGLIRRAMLRQLARRLGAALAMITLLGGRAVAQQTTERATARLRGQVVDAGSRIPLSGAELVLRRDTDTLAHGRADSLGRFNASGTVGERFTIEVRRLGYEPAALEWVAGADTIFLIEMNALPRALAGVNIVDRATTSPRLSGFEARARMRDGGTYLRRETIDAWHPIRTSDLMRRVMGVKLIDSSGVILAASTRGVKVNLKSAVMRDAPCVMRVGVDGQIKEWGFAMDAIDPNTIHGIEVYSGPATLPSEFSGMRTDSFCGLVMIWTRAGQ
jgi:hypothetical protein